MKCRCLLLGIAASLTGVASAADGRPFTVDLMLQTESIGEVMFDGAGRHLLVEKILPYESSRNFAWVRSWDRERATLLDVVPGDGAVHPVSALDSDRIWFQSYSPSGRQAAVGWFDGEKTKAGVYDFNDRKLRRFDFQIANDICAFDCPLWLSESELVHFTLSPEAQRRRLNAVGYADEVIAQRSRESELGDVPTVTVLRGGSGANPMPEPSGQLIKVDARTGRTTKLDDGLFYELEPSPDRRRLVAVRPVGKLDLTGVAVKAIGAPDEVMELAIHDFTAQPRKILPLPGCNAVLRSARWSPAGTKLFFACRLIRAGRQTYEHYIYDCARARLKYFITRQPRLETSEDPLRGLEITPFVWLSEETPAIRVATPAQRGTSRYDWHAFPPGRPVKHLTAGLTPTQDSRPLEDYVAARTGNLYLMADGALWRLSADGRRKNLTQSLGVPLSPWCSVVGFWRNGGFSPVCSGLRLGYRVRPTEGVATGWLSFKVLRDARDKVPTSKVMLFNVDTGEALSLHAPQPDDELITMSAAARSAIYRRTGSDGDRLLLVRAGQGAAEILRFNRQLAGVSGGTPVMLSRREPGETEDRIDWLLLPPGHAQGERHPLLVYFYPDATYSKSWRPNTLREVSFLNPHIPAAHGYAVLLASMRISSYEERGDPMLEMHQQLIHAAENAVAQGYADPHRWALLGHSYGGYGVDGVITQTDRFRAAVALSGAVNLTSGYADGLSARTVVLGQTGMPDGVLWSEGGQGRMGVPPWQDPQRYIRNSPLFSADKIHTPLLIVHGDADLTVSVSHAEQMFNALQRQGKDVEFLRYWGEGHTYRSPANIRDLWQRIFAWLERYLPATPPRLDNRS